MAVALAGYPLWSWYDSLLPNSYAIIAGKADFGGGPAPSTRQVRYLPSAGSAQVIITTNRQAAATLPGVVSVAVGVFQSEVAGATASPARTGLSTLTATFAAPVETYTPPSRHHRRCHHVAPHPDRHGLRRQPD